MMLYKVSPTGVISGAGVFPLPGIPSTLTFDGNTFTIDGGQVVPVQPVANQQFDVTLNQQPCTIQLVFKETFLATPAEIPTEPPFYEPIQVGLLSLYLNDTLVIGGVRCQDRNRIVRDPYLGFVGDLAFIDAQGTEDPIYTQLGTRFFLTYWPLLN